MKKKTNLALLILRVLPSALMLTHGIPKIDMLSATPIKFADPIGIGATASLILAIVAEVLAPVLMIVGYKTRWAAFFASATMAVAAFIVHASDPLKTKETALLYLSCFVAVMLAGPGRYSLRGMLARNN